MHDPRDNELQLQVHQRLLDKLTETHHSFVTHVDMLEEIIFRCTSEGALSLLNPSWSRLLGWPVESTIGCNLCDFLADAESKEIILASLKSNEPIAYDVKLKSRYGLIRHFRLRARFNGSWYGSLQDITDTLNVIEELHESKKQAIKLSQVASRTDNLVIITDANGVIEWVNQSFETITGYALSEVRGRSPGSFLQRKDTPEETIQLMSEGIRSKTGFTAELINYTKSGQPYWIAIDCSPVFDQQHKLINFIAIERDISAQKHLENMLRENERRYCNVLNSVSEPIFQCDADLKITFANNAWNRFIGCTDEDPLRRPVSRLSDLVSEDQQSLLESAVKKAFSSEHSVRQELVITIHNAQSRRVELTLSNSVNHLADEQQCLTGSLVDIEEQWQINQEILRAKQKAEELSEARTRFVANMSHEIRTPLNAIIGMTSVLEKTSLDHKQQLCLDTISKGGHALLAVINDILDFAKLDHAEQEVETITFNWNQLFEEVVDILSGDIESKKLRLLLSCHSRMPQNFRGDLHKLRQVLTNLLSNAIKFTGTGDLLIETAWEGEKDTLSENTQGRLVFSVTDSGIGIEPDRLQDLFDPFTQADASVTRNYGGTGLGLAICKQICTCLGGQITVESQLNKGTKMEVKVPLGAVWQEGTEENKNTVVLELDKLNKEDSGVLQVAESLSRLMNLSLNIEHDVAKGLLVNVLTENSLYQPAHIESSTAILTPRRILKALQVQAPYQTKPIETGEHNRSLKILVAEDSMANQVVIRALLEQLGCHDVTLVNNGLEALKHYEQDPADLVFLDIHMPIMDGFTAAEQIRAQKHWPQPVIYALTADVTSEAIESAKQFGIDLWVTKPVTGETLRQALDSYNGFKAQNSAKTSPLLVD